MAGSRWTVALRRNPPSGSPWSEVCCTECMDVIEGLYRSAGYVSDLFLWSEYRIPGGWDLGSLSLSAPVPLAHSEWVSVIHLAERQTDFVEALLDRLAQAAGLWSSRDVR